MILDVRNLSVQFGSRRVLDGVTFAVPAGASLAVIGPNGSGKTVLFRALIGALPHRGEVSWAPGTRIGYVPQKLDLARDVPVSGLELLRARRGLKHGFGLADAEAVLDLVGLSLAVCRQPIGALSAGQFQRLLMAFALAGDPTVLLLDEPTAGVDEPGQEQFNTLVNRLRRERQLTVMLISHDIVVVSQYATDVLCLGGGRSWFGPPKEILTADQLARVFGAPLVLHTDVH